MSNPNEGSNGKTDESVDEVIPTSVADLALYIKANYDDEVMMVDIAKNPLTSSETLIRLSAHSNETVVAYVAYNPSTPADLLDELSTVSENLACQVASNPSALPETLAELADLGSYNTRLALSENPSTPTEPLALMLLDIEEDMDIRWVCSDHSNLPLIRLLELSSLDDEGSKEIYTDSFRLTPEALREYITEKDAALGDGLPTDVPRSWLENIIKNLL